MNADPRSALGMLKDWHDGGCFLSLVVVGSTEGALSPISTVVQLTSLSATGFRMVLPETLVFVEISGLDIARVVVGKPMESYPAFEALEFKSRTKEPWVILVYQRYIVALAEIA